MNEGVKQEILKEFERLASHASFCFADDSGGDWHDGYKSQAEAIQLYKSNPELLPQMQEIMKRQLWRSSFLRVVESWQQGAKRPL